jgi:hypothetical protein
MSLWIYKCNATGTNNDYHGDWVSCFKTMRKSKTLENRWGGSYVTSSPPAKDLAQSAKVGQRLLCWQNWDSKSRPKSVNKSDRSAAVGIVEISKITKTGDGETSWTLRLVEEFNPPVPLLNYRKISPELNEPFVNPQRPRTFYEMSKDCELAVLRTCQSTLKESGDPIPSKVRKNPPTVGAGFGFAENNKKVEKAAIASVTRRLKHDGWKVTSVESLAVGYDLLAKQGGKKRNIEVKGVSGSKPNFIITENEASASKSDDDWELWIVTNALSKKPKLQNFTASQFNKKFVLKPISYRAQLI